MHSKSFFLSETLMRRQFILTRQGELGMFHDSGKMMVSSSSSGIRHTWVQILALPLPSRVTLGKLFNLFMPQFPH